MLIESDAGIQKEKLEKNIKIYKFMNSLKELYIIEIHKAGDDSSKIDHIQSKYKKISNKLKQYRSDLDNGVWNNLGKYKKEFNFHLPLEEQDFYESIMYPFIRVRSSSGMNYFGY
tara:strand:+ start:369 stop:713 length:345 start_codon:yes stop_codon:yes gene_type:complete